MEQEPQYTPEQERRRVINKKILKIGTVLFALLIGIWAGSCVNDALNSTTAPSATPALTATPSVAVEAPKPVEELSAVPVTTVEEGQSYMKAILTEREKIMAADDRLNPIEQFELDGSSTLILSPDAPAAFQEMRGGIAASREIVPPPEAKDFHAAWMAGIDMLEQAVTTMEQGAAAKDYVIFHDGSADRTPGYMAFLNAMPLLPDSCWLAGDTLMVLSGPDIVIRSYAAGCTPNGMPQDVD